MSAYAFDLLRPWSGILLYQSTSIDCALITDAEDPSPMASNVCSLKLQALLINHAHVIFCPCCVTNHGQQNRPWLHLGIRAAAE